MKDAYTGASFEKEFLKSLVSGYDLNITVSDINGNIAFLEKHINSLWEDFVAWLLDGIRSLCQFIAELASAAIAWIWEFVKDIIGKIISPIKNACKGLMYNVIGASHNAVSEIDKYGYVQESTGEEMSKAFFSPLFIGTLVVITTILLIIKIIGYFIPFIDFLLVGILCLIVIILTAYIGLGPIQKENIPDVSTIESEDSLNKDTLANRFISILFGEQTRISRTMPPETYLIIGTLWIDYFLITYTMAGSITWLIPFLGILWVALVGSLLIIDLFTTLCSIDNSISEDDRLWILIVAVIGYELSLSLSIIGIFELIDTPSLSLLSLVFAILCGILVAVNVHEIFQIID